MASKRDWLLQQLGITQWTLRRPSVLQGEVAVSLPPEARLLVVAQTLPAPDDPLFCDVLHSLGLTPAQTYSLTPEQAAMLPEETACNSWRLGVAEPLAVAGAQLHSPALAELSQDAGPNAPSGSRFVIMNTISTLTAADLATAFTIEQASHAFPWTETTFASNQGDRYLNLKLSADGAMAGFAITQIVLDEATLFNIAIHPQYQRRGFGRLLLNAVIEQLESRGVVTLWLEVRASNQAAIALYEDLGFNEVTVRRNYYPSAHGREDAIVMALPLG